MRMVTGSSNKRHKRLRYGNHGSDNGKRCTQRSPIAWIKLGTAAERDDVSSKAPGRCHKRQQAAPSPQRDPQPQLPSSHEPPRLQTHDASQAQPLGPRQPGLVQLQGIVSSLVYKRTVRRRERQQKNAESAGINGGTRGLLALMKSPLMYRTLSRSEIIPVAPKTPGCSRSASA